MAIHVEVKGLWELVLFFQQVTSGDQTQLERLDKSIFAYFWPSHWPRSALLFNYWLENIWIFKITQYIISWQIIKQKKSIVNYWKYVGTQINDMFTGIYIIKDLWIFLAIFHIYLINTLITYTLVKIISKSIIIKIIGSCSCAEEIHPDG